jgi:hypothetical protein
MLEGSPAAESWALGLLAKPVMHTHVHRAKLAAHAQFTLPLMRRWMRLRRSVAPSRHVAWKPCPCRTCSVPPRTSTSGHPLRQQTQRCACGVLEATGWGDAGLPMSPTYADLAAVVAPDLQHAAMDVSKLAIFAPADAKLAWGLAGLDLQSSGVWASQQGRTAWQIFCQTCSVPPSWQQHLQTPRSAWGTLCTWVPGTHAVAVLQSRA